MKQFFLFIVIATLVSSCGSGEKKTKVDKDVLFGSWEKKSYENAFFNFAIEFEEGWNIDSTQFQTSFGGTIFETSYRGSVNEYFPVNITIELDKANPFAKPSVMEKVEESMEGYEFLFDENDMIKSPIAKTKIAGEEYIVNQLKLIEGADTSYINEYYRYVDGYYLSIVSVYNDKADQQTEKEFISGIKRQK